MIDFLVVVATLIVGVLVLIGLITVITCVNMINSNKDSIMKATNDNNTIYLRIEQNKETNFLSVYNEKKNGEFVAQGKNMKELTENMIKRFPEASFYMVNSPKELSQIEGYVDFVNSEDNVREVEVGNNG